MEVPALYSTRSFRTFFVPQNAEVSARAAADGWVLEEAVDFTQEDIDAFQERVRRLYVSDYVASWRGLINGLELQPFVDLDDAEGKLQTLIGSENPYGRLLQSIERHTRISDLNPADAVSPGVDETPSSEALDLSQAREVTLAFTSLHIMDELQEGQELSNLDVALQAVERVHTYVKSITDLEESDAKALELAKEVARLSGEDPITDLRRIADALPEPFQTHFTQIADQTWTALMQSAERELDRLWNQQIYTFYSGELAQKYPFAPDALTSVSFDTFSEFLSGTGRVERFFEEHVSPFLIPGTSTPRDINGYQLNFSPEALRSLVNVREIQQAFFADDGAFGLAFSLTPIAMDSGSARSVINIDGQALPYRHGPERTVGFIWPNTLSGDSGSRVTFIPVRQGQPNVTIEGEGIWSFFRLVDQATKNDFNGGRVTLNFSEAGRRLALRVEMETTVNPFAICLGDELQVPRRLLQTAGPVAEGELEAGQGDEAAQDPELGRVRSICLPTAPEANE